MRKMQLIFVENGIEINDYDLASAAIEQPKADFIGLARSLIADKPTIMYTMVSAIILFTLTLNI